MRIEELEEKCREKDILLNDKQKNQLLLYAEILKTWNEKMNLTTITEKEEVIEKHFYDSILPLFDMEISGSVCDVGTGAGFPGVVWKIVKPDLSVTLVEPTGKRCTFLKEVISQLHLTDISVCNVRSEEHVIQYRERYDVVTARAVANLRLLSELCIPLVKENGLFIALKGMKGDEEKEEAKHASDILGCVLEKEVKYSLPSGDRVNLYYRKVRRTPEKYPRNYGQMKKKPL